MRSALSELKLQNNLDISEERLSLADKEVEGVVDLKAQCVTLTLQQVHWHDGIMNESFIC